MRLSVEIPVGLVLLEEIPERLLGRGLDLDAALGHRIEEVAASIARDRIVENSQRRVHVVGLEELVVHPAQTQRVDGLALSIQPLIAEYLAVSEVAAIQLVLLEEAGGDAPGGGEAHVAQGLGDGLAAPGADDRLRLCHPLVRVQCDHALVLIAHLVVERAEFLVLGVVHPCRHLPRVLDEGDHVLGLCRRSAQAHGLQVFLRLEHILDLGISRGGNSILASPHGRELLRLGRDSIHAALQQREVAVNAVILIQQQLLASGDGGGKIVEGLLLVSVQPTLALLLLLKTAIRLAILGLEIAHARADLGQLRVGIDDHTVPLTGRGKAVHVHRRIKAGRRTSLARHGINQLAHLRNGGIPLGGRKLLRAQADHLTQEILDLRAVLERRLHEGEEIGEGALLEVGRGDVPVRRVERALRAQDRRGAHRAQDGWLLRAEGSNIADGRFDLGGGESNERGR